MLPILLVAAFLLEVSVQSAAQITGYGNRTVNYGSDAYYGCAANLTGVLQVTWQRLFKDDSIENLATYSKRFGQQVNDPHQKKVIFTEASLTFTSITLKNVTWQDESCYICSFNVYPDGSKRKQTCLVVQGISQVKTHVQGPSLEHDEEDMEELVFSCSATGKPAPTISWEIPAAAVPVHEPEMSTTSNSDHTFTSSRNITLHVPLDWSGHVGCLLNDGKIGQRLERISFSPDHDHSKKNDKGKRLSSSGIALVICAVAFLSFIAVAAALKRKRLKSNKRTETV